MQTNADARAYRPAGAAWPGAVPGIITRMAVDPGFHLLIGAASLELATLQRAADRLLAGSHAARNALRRAPEVSACADRWARHPAIRAALGDGAFPVRGLIFDKIPGANWQVPWHRDRLIAVQRRIALPGWGTWSVKDGVCHVDPPEPWSSRRLAIRIHLDDCPAGNGALQVLPGSHRDLTADVSPVQAITITADAGDVLIMHPLLLHASSPAVMPDRRRIIHIEYAADPLPGGLAWEVGDSSA